MVGRLYNFENIKNFEIPANPVANPPPDRIPSTQTNNAIFQITNAKLYVPVVTLSINDNIKSWNKYRSEKTSQTKNNNLYYLIDPTFRKVNRLFVLSFKNSANDLTRDYFDKYYFSLEKSKDFNALIDNKPFLSTLKKQTRKI